MDIILLDIIFTFFLRTIPQIFLSKSNNSKSKNLKNGERQIMTVFSYIFQIFEFFGLLVYLEIIKLNFCGLNYDLKKNIIERSIDEYKSNRSGEIGEIDEKDEQGEQGESILDNSNIKDSSLIDKE